MFAKSYIEVQVLFFQKAFDENPEEDADDDDDDETDYQAIKQLYR